MFDRILDQNGKVIASTFTMATCGSGCRGTWETDVPYDVTATQPGTIRVYEVSAMDGSKINVVNIPGPLSVATTLTRPSGQATVTRRHGSNAQTYRGDSKNTGRFVRLKRCEVADGAPTCGGCVDGTVTVVSVVARLRLLKEGWVMPQQWAWWLGVVLAVIASLSGTPSLVASDFFRISGSRFCFR